MKRTSTAVLALGCLIVLASTSQAGVYFVVHRLIRQPDGSVMPSAGASFLDRPGTSPSARDLAKESAAEEAKKPDVVKAWVVKEDDSVAGASEAVAGSDEAGSDPKSPPDSGERSKKLLVEDRAKSLTKGLAKKFRESAKEAGGNPRTDIASIAKRVETFAKSYGSALSANDANFDEMNAAIKETNRVLQSLQSGPAGGSFADLKPLKPFAANATGREAEAQMLLVQTKLKEVGLRVAKTELVEQKEVLEVAMQQIAADKAEGIDVSEQEKELAEAITAFESEKSKFQKEIGGYTEFRDKLDTVRKEIKEEKLAADRAKREEEERLAAAKRREEERMAAEKRREEERIAAAREKEMADKIADQNRREAEAVRKTRQSNPQGTWSTSAPPLTMRIDSNGSGRFVFPSYTKIKPKPLTWSLSDNSITIKTDEGFHFRGTLRDSTITGPAKGVDGSDRQLTFRRQ